MVENSLNQQKEIKKRPKGHNNCIVQRQNFESSKEKAICHMKGYPHKTIEGFFRNLASQKGVG